MGKTTDSPIFIGVTTVVVNVGGQVPLVLTGTIDKITTLSSLRHHESCDSPVIVTGKVGEITEEEQFLILDVTAAILPPGFPLTIAQLTTDVAINFDSIILILPVEA